jgi:hypothetical protein
LDGFGLVTNRLSDGDDPDTMLGQSAEIELLLEGFPEKPAVAVNNDKSECMLTIAGAFNHLLENWPAVVNGRCSRFDELGHDFVALALAPGLQLAALIRDRKIVFRLPSCRDAHVERRPRGRWELVD